MKRRIDILILAILLILGGFGGQTFAATLTSVTLEAVTDTGTWLNAAYGIWSTNVADPLTQLGVMQNGVFLNMPGTGFDLGEISIVLNPGLNTFGLYGTAIIGGFSYYGLDLFFDGIPTPPKIVVHNAAGDPGGNYTVTPAGTIVAGSANGGLFPDLAPGTDLYTAADGSTVRLLSFTADYSPANPDLVSWGNIQPDGYPDTVGQFTLEYRPVPEPSTTFLLASGIIGLIALSMKKPV